MICTPLLNLCDLAKPAGYSLAMQWLAAEISYTASSYSIIEMVAMHKQLISETNQYSIIEK